MAGIVFHPSLKAANNVDLPPSELKLIAAARDEVWGDLVAGWLIVAQSPQIELTFRNYTWDLVVNLRFCDSSRSPRLSSLFSYVTCLMTVSTCGAITVQSTRS
jgi:hypothetical protein